MRDPVVLEDTIGSVGLDRHVDAGLRDRRATAKKPLIGAEIDEADERVETGGRHAQYAILKRSSRSRLTTAFDEMSLNSPWIENDGQELVPMFLIGHGKDRPFTGRATIFAAAFVGAGSECDPTSAVVDQWREIPIQGIGAADNQALSLLDNTELRKPSGRLNDLLVGHEKPIAVSQKRLDLRRFSDHGHRVSLSRQS